MTRFATFSDKALSKITSLKYEFQRIGKLKKSTGDLHVHTMKESAKKIVEKLNSNESCMISRFGNTELATIFYYHQHKGEQSIRWPESYKIEMFKQSGFYPTTDESLSQFSSLFLEGVKNIDILGVWYHPGEDVIIKSFIPNSYLVPLRALEPYYYQKPWSTSAFENRNILVIHPFADTIQKQFSSRRKNLFPKEVLPEFNLQTIKAVQSLGKKDDNFDSWFDGFHFMCDEISKREFDIALIGAGAYGLPLASFVKNMGKKAVHLGGATQILFGIKGKRWDEHDVISQLYNEYWVRPSANETPVDKDNVADNGSYW